MTYYHKWIATGSCALAISLGFGEEPSSKMNQSTSVHSSLTPLVGPIATDRPLFSLSADFIYWLAQEDNLNVGISGVSLSNSSFISTSEATRQGKLQSIDFEYEPGLQFGIGLDFTHDGWDTYLNYTWLEQTHAAGSILFEPNTGSLNGLVFNLARALSDSTARPDHCWGNWSLYFNAIDWELGRNFYISKRLALRPHIGLKGAWNHQRYNVFESVSSLDIYAQTYQRQKFWGVGLRAGLDSEWHFTRSLSIYGSLAATEMSCQFQDKVASYFIDDLNLPPVTTLTPILNTEHSFHVIRPVIEMGIGLRYAILLDSHEDSRFLIQVGWEQQIWWDQNQFLSTFAYLGGTGGQNLVLQGLDVKVGFTF